MHPHGIKTPSTFFTFAALLAMLMVWRGWKRYGGAAGYQAP